MMKWYSAGFFYVVFPYQASANDAALRSPWRLIPIPTEVKMEIRSPRMDKGNIGIAKLLQMRRRVRPQTAFNYQLNC